MGGGMAPGGGDYGAAMKSRMAGGMPGMPKMGGEGMGRAAPPRRGRPKGISRRRAPTG